jgi:hypothetical protein
VPDIDSFANQLLEEAKRFLENAGGAGSGAGEAANLHAALMLAFCALEAYVNAVGMEFSVSPILSVHEKGMLLEKEVRLRDGQFQLADKLKMAGLEDRIEFLYTKFSGVPADRVSASWWGELSGAVNLRNKLTHAKDVPAISRADVERAIRAIIATLSGLYRAVYKREFPPALRDLQSDLTF